MIAAIAACWLLLLLPGFVVVRRFAAEELEAGLPAAVGVCAIASGGLLAPVVVVCYLIETPLVVLSGLVGLAVLASIAAVMHFGWWRDLGRLLLTGLALEMAVVVVDLVLGGRVGAILGADAVEHIGRVRFLVDHGLTNADPFVSAEYFYPTYHTNIWHALLAVVSQISRADHVTVWYAGLPVAKMLIVSGGAYAAWALFRSKWAALAVALFVLGHRGPITFLVYPNQLAPWFLLPMLVAFAVRATVDRRWSGVAGVGVVALLLGMVHPMYAAFAVLALGPVVAVAAFVHLVRPRGFRLGAMACAGALLLALPWPAIGHMSMRASAGARRPSLVEAATASTSKPLERMELSSLMKRFDNGWVMHRLGRGFSGSQGFRVAWLVGAFAIVLAGSRRRAGLVVLGVFAAVAVFIYVPPLCTRLLAGLGAEWMLHRFATFQDVVFALLVPAAFATLVERFLAEQSASPRRIAPLLTRWSLGAAAIYGGAHCAHQPRPYTWKHYVERAAAPRGVRTGGTIRPLLRLRDDLSRHLPPGSVVLAHESLAMQAVMVHDCRIVVPSRGGVGVEDLTERRRDLRRMLRRDTDDQERDELIRHYGVTHALGTMPPSRWLFGRIREFRLVDGDRYVAEFRRPDDPEDLRVAGDYGVALLEIARDEYRGARYIRAWETLEAVDELRPGDPRVGILRGRTLVELDRHADAVKVLETTIAEAERRGDTRSLAAAWFNLGHAYFRQQCWDDAFDAYQRTLDTDPEHADAPHWRERARMRLLAPDGGE
jgi:hypothetical protein